MATKKNVKKRCLLCNALKKANGNFYRSISPLHSDGYVSICTKCVKANVLNENGTINEAKLKQMCLKLDKPYYVDTLSSAFAQFKKENSYLSEDEIQKSGDKIVGLYFRHINSLKQNKNKTFADSDREGYIHESVKLLQTANRIQKDELESLAKERNEKLYQEYDDFVVTKEMIDLFGEGYTSLEYKKMQKKYEDMKINYSIQTNLHQEALVTYVRFKVKEEMATAKGDVLEAQKWYSAAQNAAENGKLTPRQLTQADLQGGINSFSEIFKAVEQAVDVIPILPRFKYRPNDALDFNIWCYINYARDLQGLPQCEYEDVYKFYDKKKAEYLEQYGDPYGIFDEDPTEKNRPIVEKFITLPNDYKDGDE